MSDLAQLEFFVVKNRDGKYYRKKGYGGYGDTWVDDIKRARVYTKIGGARTTVGYFANNYPTYGVPTIVKMTVAEVEVIDETERVEKARIKKQDAKERARVRAAEYRLEQAKKEAEAAVAEYKALQKKKGKK